MMKDIIDYQKNAVVAVTMGTDDVLMSIGQNVPNQGHSGIEAMSPLGRWIKIMDTIEGYAGITSC